MNKVMITYIDDAIDNYISRYLGELYQYPNSEVEVEIEEFPFLPDQDLDILFEKDIIRKANVILIDSRLFKNSNVRKKMKGEQVLLLLKKINPFIKTIIISQNEDDLDIGIIKKFKSSESKKSSHDKAMEYYQQHLGTKLNEAIKSVLKYRTIRENTPQNEDTKIIIEQIDNLMEGDLAYSDIKQQDIDNLILTIKRWEENINE